MPPSIRQVLFFITWLRKGDQVGCDSGQPLRALSALSAVKLDHFRRHSIFSEDRLDRAFRDASVAVDASLRMNHKHIVIQMESLNWTNEGTVSVGQLTQGSATT